MVDCLFTLTGKNLALQVYYISLAELKEGASNLLSPITLFLGNHSRRVIFCFLNQLLSLCGAFCDASPTISLSVEAMTGTACMWSCPTAKQPFLLARIGVANRLFRMKTAPLTTRLLIVSIHSRKMQFSEISPMHDDNRCGFSTCHTTYGRHRWALMA